MTKGGWVYLMANHVKGTLYIGVTNDLARRVAEHKQGTGSRFTYRYDIKRLVYAEHHDDIATAIQRETSLKRWPRAWKLALIESQNPEWKDLGEELVQMR
jgi:putative endonuclease